MPFDGSNLSEVKLLLIRARERIEKKGWCQGAFHRGSASCMMGALGYTRKRGCPSGLHYMAGEQLRSFVGGDLVPHWNDRPGRTKAEVLEVFDKAIASVD